MCCSTIGVTEDSSLFGGDAVSVIMWEPLGEAVSVIKRETLGDAVSVNGNH